MRSRASGVFITFEGTEGAGKSTLIRLLASRLKATRANPRLPFVVTREPGGTRLAEVLRAYILEHPMDSRTELFLYSAARADHVAQVIDPALRDDGIVLCDRFTDSSLAYQGTARGLPWKEIDELNRLATHGRKPDLTVLLDIDPAEGLRRASDHNRFEKEGVAFQAKVRQGFLKSRRRDPQRWLVLKVAGQAPETLADTIFRELQRRFPSRFGRSPSPAARARPPKGKR